MLSINQLQIWKDSHALTLEIYKLTANFPTEERYNLVSQLRRAAYSIPSNIVEGYHKPTKEYCRFLKISFASASELEYFLLLSKDLNYLNQDEYKQLICKIIPIQKVLFTFIKKLNAKI